MNNLAIFTVLVHVLSIVLAKESGIHDCDLVCSSTEIRPICGSDGETYQSKCLLRLKKCISGTKLHVDYDGPCRAPPSCTEERKRVFKSIREKGLLSVGIFIPKCDDDGTYSSVQCHKSSSICWCVDKYGEELENTRVRFKQPDCRVRPPRSHPYSSSFARFSRILKGCSPESRISYNKKVVTSFKKEMAKQSKKKAGKLTFEEIVQWKMQQLDVDKSGYLQHKEVKPLMKKLKKAYSPRKCGKTLFFYCDKDQDYVISKKEWSTCLGFKGSNTKTTHQPDISKCLKEKLATSELQKKNVNLIWFVPSCNADGTYTSVQCEKQSKYCWCVDPITGRNIPNSSVRNAKPDCSKHLNPTQVTSHSPIKYSLGRFRKAHTRPAKIHPKSERSKTVLPKSGRGKKVKECDDSNWARFCDELLLILRKELEAITSAKFQVRANTTRRGLTSAPNNFLHAISQRLPDTMILAWKFSQLDSDSDRLVNSDELFVSHMKKVFGRIRRGRKCSKKLVISCDFDRNGGLSLGEWRKCLRKKNPKSTSSVSSSFRPGFLGR